MRVLTSWQPHSGQATQIVDIVGASVHSVCLTARIFPGSARMAGLDSRQATGRQGETLARSELERRGYAILAEGFRTRCGEIDLIARQGATLVFVEVRTRRVGTSGSAAESVTRRKQLQVARMAAAYLATHPSPDVACRFDVVAIDYDAAGEPRIVVYENAFEVN